jgi:Ala-tRNA(Pro) deacylase
MFTIYRSIAMITSHIKNYLKSHDVSYKTIAHPQTYTASQAAQSAHVSGKYFAKSVIVKLDGKYAMATIPANERLNLDSLKSAAHAKEAKIVHEYEFKDKFDDCEIGAMPPFGELYKMDVYMADSLAQQKWLVFNGGTHNELLKLSSNDYMYLENPKILKSS